MKRAIKIGDIILDNPLFYEESYQTKHVKAVAFNTLGGGRIIYESIKRDNANNITLISKDNGWLKEQTIKNIVFLADDIGIITKLKFDDGAIVNVRFRLEDGPIKYEPLYEGSVWYRVTIKLAII